jgi:hypothetical protein
LSQQGVVGLGGDAEDDLADLEFGLAEEVAVIRGHEGTGELQQVGGGGLLEFLGQALGLGFWVGGEGGTRQGGLRDEGGLPDDVSTATFVYKYSTNFQDAYPAPRSMEVFA